MYSVRGLSAGSALVANSAVAALWNPSATAVVKVVYFSLFVQASLLGVATVVLNRISARGVAGSTITPVIQNDSKRGAAPPSGFLLDLGVYTTEPTLDGVPLGIGWPNNASLPGLGVTSVIPGGLWLPPGRGVAIINPDGATIAWTSSEVEFTVSEDQ